MTATIIIILLLFYIVYLFKHSSSDFFLQNNLSEKINLLENILKDYGFSNLRKYYIINCFKYFRLYPKEFDGATIVKDITQIKNLDVPAMAHDFAYINAKNIKDRLRADWNYAQDYRQFDVPWTIAYSRMALLMFINITGIYFIKNLIKK